MADQTRVQHVVPTEVEGIAGIVNEAEIPSGIRSWLGLSRSAG
jgi:hypothetical protein